MIKIINDYEDILELMDTGINVMIIADGELDGIDDGDGRVDYMGFFVNCLCGNKMKSDESIDPEYIDVDFRDKNPEIVCSKCGRKYTVIGIDYGILFILSMDTNT